MSLLKYLIGAGAGAFLAAMLIEMEVFPLLAGATAGAVGAWIALWIHFQRKSVD